MAAHGFVLALLHLPPTARAPGARRARARLEKLTAWHMPQTQSIGAPGTPPPPPPAAGCGAMLYSSFSTSPCSASACRPGASMSARASSTLAKSCAASGERALVHVAARPLRALVTATVAALAPRTAGNSPLALSC